MPILGHCLRTTRAAAAGPAGVVCAAAADRGPGTVANLARDRARRPVQLTEAEAREMLDEIRDGARLVDARRSPPLA
jgi:hypothetical protein